MQIGDYYFLRPGGLLASAEPIKIHTVLGSCVSVCIFDSVNCVGGMNHFIYHHSFSNIRSCRYGDVAVLHLIKQLVELGGETKNFTAHLVGGAKNFIPDSIVGDENVKIAKEILLRNNIRIDVVDVGGNAYRKVVFHNLSGEIEIKKGQMQNA